MPGGAVHLDGDPAVCAGEGIVDGAVFAVDVREGILQIDILPLLGAEDIAEELDELFLRAAVAGAGSFFHGHDGLLAGAKYSGGEERTGERDASPGSCTVRAKRESLPLMKALRALRTVGGWGSGAAHKRGESWS